MTMAVAGLVICRLYDHATNFNWQLATSRRDGLNDLLICGKPPLVLVSGQRPFVISPFATPVSLPQRIFDGMGEGIGQRSCAPSSMLRKEYPDGFSCRRASRRTISRALQQKEWQEWMWSPGTALRYPSPGHHWSRAASLYKQGGGVN
ncbi:hypothetical protein L596_004244 [Steinernema carpocapsae]|uniref:Uncharacterized protein n=1 Tax=Steinernema carpocapsae TaxID=34508 RepID=A0A4U8UW76_STECR|nr:hypothetical protein L596_004244 [Steinernema carpocapsae]